MKTAQLLRALGKHIGLCNFACMNAALLVVLCGRCTAISLWMMNCQCFPLNIVIWDYLRRWVEMMAPAFSKAAWQCVWYMIQVHTLSSRNVKPAFRCWHQS